MTFTKEQVEHYLNAAEMTQVCDFDKGKLIAVKPEHMIEFARMALAGMETKHNSVIAEQLDHVLSGMDVTAHQRAVISCAVDRLNKNAELLQQSPQPLTTSERAELENYRNAQQVVPGDGEIFEAAIDICRKSDSIDEHAWNHGVLAVMSAFSDCRAAMQSGAVKDGWVACSERMPDGCHGVWAWSDVGTGFAVEAYFDGSWYRTLTDEEEHKVTHWKPLPAAPQLAEKTEI